MSSDGTFAGGNIPRVLHQTWRSEMVPQGLYRVMQSWRIKQPRWRFRFHTDADNRALVAKAYSWLVPTYERLSPIQRADLSRYLYMHHYGGVYSDLDVELLQPLRSLFAQQRALHNASVIIGQEPLAHAVILERRPRQICNAILASAPGHPLWLEVIRSAAAAPPLADPVSSTGPRMLEAVLDRWTRRRRGAMTRCSLGVGSGCSLGGGVVIVAPDVFYPTWDPMQRSTFRQRCSQDFPRLRRAAANELPLTTVCARLQRERYQPQVPADGSAFTNHLWHHTWIPGAEKTDLRRVVRLKVSGTHEARELDLERRGS